MAIRCIYLVLGLTLAISASCAGLGDGTVHGNEGGSSPISESEIPAYQKAVNRCHKTGGTRVVKIDGNLRCF